MTFDPSIGPGQATSPDPEPGSSNEAKHADSLVARLSKHAYGIVDARYLHFDRPVSDAGLFVAKHLRHEPPPSNSWDQTKDHRPNPELE